MERRRHVRLVAQDNVFAALRASFTKVGKIRDISLGGLAFEYMTDQASDKKGDRVDVFVSGNTFYLSRIPCTVVYDIPARTPFGDGRFFQTFMSKQCGLEFTGLTKNETEDLHRFLERNATETGQGSPEP